MWVVWACFSRGWLFLVGLLRVFHSRVFLSAALRPFSCLSGAVGPLPIGWCWGWLPRCLLPCFGVRSWVYRGLEPYVVPRAALPCPARGWSVGLFAGAWGARVRARHTCLFAPWGVPVLRFGVALRLICGSSRLVAFLPSVIPVLCSLCAQRAWTLCLAVIFMRCWGLNLALRQKFPCISTT